MRCRKLTRLSIPFFALCLLLGQTNSLLAYPGEEQIEWLKSRQDPNADLVNSFDDGTDFAYTFDQALVVIAFTHSGESQRAQRILDKMTALASDCNTIWNEWYRLADPNNMCWDWGSHKYVTGPITWMVMAINYYEWKTKDPNYADIARQALGQLENVKVTDPNGALRFCEGPRCGQYDPGEPNWISTEHNIDAYSAYLWRGIIDSNESYLATAKGLLDYLRKEMWGPSQGSNCCRTDNVFCRGWNDCVVATDCQTWGVLSLGRVGPGGEQFYRSLDWLWTDEDSTRTQQDYNDSIQDVNGFKSNTGETNDYVWVDGTEHVASAFYSIGQNDLGNSVRDQMRRIIDSNGALVHSFSETDPNNIRWPENHRYPYVASVAWHYFNEAEVNPFNPAPCKSACLYYSTQCHGDSEGDGTVNTADWLVFHDSFFKCCPDPDYNPCGDYTRDGCVNTEDWPAFRDNLGGFVEPNCLPQGTWPPL